MTPLEQDLIRRIAVSGPVTIAEYMAEALLHPDHGYYMRQDPFGRAGDFITAPEISQMFGEMLGLALAQHWHDQGAPDRFTLAELGPGRGTLMADILRATRAVPGFHAAAEIHLIEASPTLRALQAETLGPVTHHAHLSDLPDGPLWLIANEFFDALPLRQAVRSGTGWRERMIGVVDGRLAFGLAPEAPLAALEPRLEGTAEGQLVEWHPALPALAEDLGARIARHGGGALIVDYGHWGGLGDSFQALRGHQKVSPLDGPGSADLTAHVDFAALAHAAQPATHSALADQGFVLEQLGITARAQALAERLTGAALEAHIAAHRRLTHPDEMGTLFKMLALAPPSQPLPPGFAPAPDQEPPDHDP